MFLFFQMRHSLLGLNFPYSSGERTHNNTINSNNLQRCFACVFATAHFTQAKQRCKLPVIENIML